MTCLCQGFRRSAGSGGEDPKNQVGDAVNAFIDVNEANNLDASEPRNCADRSNTATQSGNLANRKATSIPKHLVPCPYLRRGHCLKGGKCDFSHNINVQQPFQFAQQRTLPLNFPQPLMNYPIYHPFLNFSYPQPLMDTTVSMLNIASNFYNCIPNRNYNNLIEVPILNHENRRLSYPNLERHTKLSFFL